jgi:hypothetical protein
MIFPIDTGGEELTQADLDALNRHLAAKSMALNMTPRPEMGDLSPAEVAHLLYTSWGEPGAAVQFNDDISSALLESSTFLRQIRMLLQAVHEADGVKATAAGYLTRKFVAKMVDCILDEEAREDVWRFHKVVNEHDIAPLHNARVIAQEAGLIRRYKGKFVVPKKRVGLLSEERGSELFRDLFVVHFRRINLAYLAWTGPEAGALQKGVPYTLYRLGVVAADWLKVEGAEDALVLPGIRLTLEDEVGNSTFWSVGNLLKSRILMSLVDWGLLEGRYTDQKYFMKELEAVRVTPLYKAFLRFELDATYRPDFSYRWRGDH